MGADPVHYVQRLEASPLAKVKDMSRTTRRRTHMNLSQSVNGLVAEGGYVLASDGAAASVLDTNSSISATVDSQASTPQLPPSTGRPASTT
jgi:hypothetical protein